MNKILLLTSLASIAQPIQLFAQESDPYRENVIEEKLLESAQQPVVISLCYEVFSVPLAKAATLQREKVTESALYQEIVKGLTTETTKQELFTVLRLSSGREAKSESVTEFVYATEYVAATLPNNMAIEINDRKQKDQATPAVQTEDLENAPTLDSIPKMITPATPRSFETRNVGATLEVISQASPKSFEVRNIGATLEAIATLSADNKFIYLELHPELNTFVGWTSWDHGSSKLKMPTFETQRMETEITIRPNLPLMIGTLNQAPFSRLNPDSSDSVFYAFVTATFVRP